MSMVIGQGTTLTWKGSTVGKGTVARGPQIKPDRIDATNFDSSGSEEKIPGIKRGSGVHWECNVDDATDAGQWAIVNDDGTSGAWVLTYASGYVFSGNGFISYEYSSTAAGIETFSVDIETTGTITKSSPS